MANDKDQGTPPTKPPQDTQPQKPQADSTPVKPKSAASEYDIPVLKNTTAKPALPKAQEPPKTGPASSASTAQLKPQSSPQPTPQSKPKTDGQLAGKPKPQEASPKLKGEAQKPSAKKSQGSPSAKNTPPKATPPKTPPPASKNSRNRLSIFVALLAAIGVILLAIYGKQVQDNHQQQIDDLTSLLKESHSGTQQQDKKFTAINRRLDTAKISTQQAHNLVDQRLQQQRKQIRLLSSTSRDDWRLAEAEYLLRLAGQRLLMERGAVGALALMQAADRILFELDDLDLFSVREQLARDMTALKLIASVDQSGIYLQLGSLSEQVDKLPLLPNQLDESDTTDVALIKVEPAVDEASNWEKIKSNFVRTFSTVGDYIQVRTHDKAPETLLPIDGGLYLQQNIRFSIERAQLALLREEQAIYSDALQQAADLIQRYYAMQPAAKFIAEELRALAQVNVDVTLPSINASLLALQDYTSKLHKLNADPSPLPNTDAAAKSSLDTEE